ncbi:MAG: peptidylprolyl isomerase [Planctomycetota bacterium]
MAHSSAGCRLVFASCNALALISITGCSLGTRQVEPADFVGNSTGNSARPSVEPDPVYAAVIPPPPTGAIRIGASDQTIPLETPATSESDETESQPRRSAPLLLDAKVGDVNGRPIIASAFLAELLPRLTSLSRTEASRSAWRTEARRIIREKLDTTIRDEILYREARAQLPEEVRQGLFFFLERGRQQLRRSFQGSETIADRRLRSETGLGLAETLDLERRQAVIAQILNTAAADYAPVTWSDVRNEYDRRYDEFNPPPLVFARMILTSDANADAVATRLENGEAFDAVAQDAAINRYRRTQAGSIDDDGRPIQGDLDEAELVGIEPLNAALVALEPGGWAGPVAYAEGRVGFVFLERIQSTARSLDDGDLQLELRAEIDWRRRIEARTTFLNTLLEEARLGRDERNRIADQLLEIAEARVFGLNL